MTRELQRTISPVDGSVCAEIELASRGDLDAMLERAVAAQRSWKNVSIDERAAICRRAVELMVGRAERIATELTWQMGRPLAQSPLEIRRGFQERAAYMIGVFGPRTIGGRPTRFNSALNAARSRVHTI